VREPADVPAPDCPPEPRHQLRLDHVPLDLVAVRLHQQPDRIACDPEDPLDHGVVVALDDHHVAALDGVALVIMTVEQEDLAGAVGRGH